MSFAAEWLVSAGITISGEQLFGRIHSPLPALPLVLCRGPLFGISIPWLNISREPYEQLQMEVGAAAERGPPGWPAMA